jgi:Domain of unknown function (DUF4783)
MMRFVKNIGLASLLVGCLSGFIEPTKPRDVEIAEKIKSSIRTGNAKMLADHFEKNLELVIDTEKVSFKNVQHEQAGVILKTFFKKHPPKDFRYIFQGTASKVRYCTATYQDITGGTFQVYILMRITEKDYRINTLHFKKE